MAQQHLDRLSSTDVSFLTNESSSSHMHVGAIMIFEGPPPSYEDIGAALDMPIGSIGPTRARCLERLRGLAEGEGVSATDRRELE